MKYKSQKYAAEMSDEETDDSGDEVNSQSKDSDKQEENREQKNTGEKENPAQNGQMPSSNGPVSAFDDESAWEDEDDDDAFDNATTLKSELILHVKKIWDSGLGWAELRKKLLVPLNVRKNASI